MNDSQTLIPDIMRKRSGGVTVDSYEELLDEVIFI